MLFLDVVDSEWEGNCGKTSYERALCGMFGMLMGIERMTKEKTHNHANVCNSDSYSSAPLTAVAT
jgi:hypothetical protein